MTAESSEQNNFLLTIALLDGAKKVWGFVWLMIFSIVLITTAIADTETIWFSKTSGFYSEAFFLEMNCTDGEIYYTLDSTDPDENSFHYTSPILIDESSYNPENYSYLPDVCLELTDKNPMLRNCRGYQIPAKPVDKAIVVRACCIKNGKKSEITNAIYFIGYRKKELYGTANIISVVTEPENLFDKHNGIYVLGDIFYKNNTDETIQKADNYGHLKANYTQKGRDWEKEAWVCLFNENREIILEGSFGLRIQGGTSRALLPKSLNFFARKEYGKESTFKPLMEKYHWETGSINLYSGSHCMATKLNDYLANMMTLELSIASRQFELYELFLDGEYWGTYWLIPRYEYEFFKSNYGISYDDIIMIKPRYSEMIEMGEKDDVNFYYNTRDYICSEDMNNTEAYEIAKEMIDVENYIDYYATEIYIENNDWPTNNFALWRTKHKQDDRYGDGRWRWMLFDVNLSMDPFTAKSDYVQRTINNDPMFASLMENDDFRTRFYTRLLDMANDYFAPDRIDAFIDEYETKMIEPMRNEYLRFYGDKSIVDFINGCENIRRFFHLRHEYIIEKYGNTL